MENTFSLEDSLRFGWTKTKQHSLVLFEVLLTLFALNVVQGIVEKTLEHTLVGGLASLILAAAGIVVGTGLLIITFKISRDEAVTYRDIWPPLPLVWQLFLVSILAGLLVMAGLILLVAPGIYFALRFSMVRYAVLDGAGILESFEKSSKLTDGHKWQLLGFFIVFMLLNILGALLFLVGLLITIPVTMIAYAHIYNQLRAKQPAAAVAAEPATPAPVVHDDTPAA